MCSCDAKNQTWGWSLDPSTAVVNRAHLCHRYKHKNNYFYLPLWDQPCVFYACAPESCDFLCECFFLSVEFVETYKKKDPKWKMHYLRFHHNCTHEARWRTKYCRGLYLGGEISYTKTSFASNRSVDQHWNVLRAASGFYSPVHLHNFIRNGLHLPHVPNGITQFTLVSSNVDVHLGKK